MKTQATHIAAQAIRFIEDNLNDKLELESIASALHYSKFHLHRLFAKTVGLTIHEYAIRRQITEAAKLLVFSQKPIIEIALISGYESQQAFTSAFKALYKSAPAEFRAAEEFYPLQLEIHLKDELVKNELSKENIVFAEKTDIEDWMELVSLSIDGFPCLNQKEYRESLIRYIDEKSALILRDGDMLIGAMGISYINGSIDFLAVHPQYRQFGIAKIFLDKLMSELLCGKEISTTTYRENDKADTGYRKELYQLGFAERELLIEYGYPTQKFVLSPKNKEEAQGYERKE